DGETVILAVAAGAETPRCEGAPRDRDGSLVKAGNCFVEGNTHRNGRHIGRGGRRRADGHRGGDGVEDAAELVGGGVAVAGGVVGHPRDQVHRDRALIRRGDGEAVVLTIGVGAEAARSYGAVGERNVGGDKIVYPLAEVDRHGDGRAVGRVRRRRIQIDRGGDAVEGAAELVGGGVVVAGGVLGALRRNIHRDWSLPVLGDGEGVV